VIEESACFTMPNVVSIGQIVAEICPFFNFSKWHITVQNFNCQYSSEVQDTSPC